MTSKINQLYNSLFSHRMGIKNITLPDFPFLKGNQQYMGGGCRKTRSPKSENLRFVSASDDSCLSTEQINLISSSQTPNPRNDTYELKVENSRNRVFRQSGGGG